MARVVKILIYEGDKKWLKSAKSKSEMCGVSDMKGKGSARMMLMLPDENEEHKAIVDLVNLTTKKEGDT